MEEMVTVYRIIIIIFRLYHNWAAQGRKTIFNHSINTRVLQVNGFFIEVGALDGERGSNTLWLEEKKNWNGLLIEMDPHFYTQLKGHSRRAWTINCCLSPYNYTIMVS